MRNIKRVGFNYLHSHPTTERMLNVDSDHVIVDRKEFEEVINYFYQYPNEIKKLGKIKSKFLIR
jgi:UDP-N-acetylmuramate-alanine ligase